MLCIRRLEGESIIIGGNIEVKIYDISHIGGNKQAKLAITAPKSISIHRKEVQEAIDREELESSQALTV